MNNTYNANLYLTKNDLNNIENEIESLTNEIQEKVFNNQLSPLRNIQVGDNLNGKTLYISFPRDIYQEISNTTVSTLINTSSNNISYQHVNNAYRIWISYDSATKLIYYKDDYGINLVRNHNKIKLPNDFGIVTSINTNNNLYQYIKIYDDETIIPNYVKHTWTDNEVLSMQKIDNIENAIKNIGDYYYKPNGWVANREWLKPTYIGDNSNTTNKIQNISYQDLNRWLIDLELINFDNLDNMCIWNSDISNIQWNKYNDTDWEEY